MAHDVFISHSQHDKTLADAACARLEAHGIRCWIAPRDVRPGADWADAIVEAIGSSRVFVLIFSGAALGSNQVKREITLAANHELIIMPVRTENIVPTGQFAYYLSDRHWLDVVDGSIDEHLLTLARTIARVLGKPEPQVSSTPLTTGEAPTATAPRAETEVAPATKQPAPEDRQPEMPAAMPLTRTEPTAVRSREVRSRLSAPARHFVTRRQVLTTTAIALIAVCGMVAWKVVAKHGAPNPSKYMTGSKNPSASLAPPPFIASDGTRINSKDGAEMIHVPAGEFLMGSNDGDSDERPERKVFLDGYYIYKNLVTVAQYRRFCLATKGKMPPAPDFNPNWSKEDHPIVNVRWKDAQKYCEWAGVSLPSEAQWEKAARGTDGTAYPWGNAWDPAKCINSAAKRRSGTSPVGSCPSGAGPYGALDMAGNAWEWCLDWYDEKYYDNAPSRNPPGPTTGTSRVLRGGSWNLNVPRLFRASLRLWLNPTDRYLITINVGFRCAVRSDSL